jgi:aldose 1-epimerase
MGAPPATIMLRREKLLLELMPTCGGAVTRFAALAGERAVEFFRPAPATLPEHLPVLATACFPLVPFSGRIRDAKLAFGGRTYDLPRSLTGEANARHGEGWLVPWRVERAGENEASLAYRGVGLGWPFAYSAGQRFELRQDRLIAEIWIENDGRHPMPAGIGLHPFFMATPEVQLTMRATRVWLVDAGNLFDRTAPVPERWDFSTGRRLAATNLVNGFSG